MGKSLLEEVEDRNMMPPPEPKHKKGKKNPEKTTTIGDFFGFRGNQNPHYKGDSARMKPTKYKRKKKKSKKRRKSNKRKKNQTKRKK